MPDIPARPSSVTHDKYERLVKAAQTEAIIKVAVVHPCDDVSRRSHCVSTTSRSPSRRCSIA